MDFPFPAPFDPAACAAAHPIRLDKPAVRFCEGALLGNGGLGAVVCSRPDAVMIHFGHNAVWDVRVDESHAGEIGTFAELFARVEAVPQEYASLEDDPWCKAYFARMRAPYRKPYPRPFPCGTLLLTFDRRHTELLGHTLHIATGLCEVQMRVAGAPARLQIFCAPDADQLWLRMVDAADAPMAAPFDRVLLLPDPETPAEFPPYVPQVESSQGQLAFTQVLPYLEPHAYNRAAGHAQDRALRLAVRVSDRLERRNRENWAGVLEEMGELERGLRPQGPFTACVQLEEGLAADLHPAPPPTPTQAACRQAAAAARAGWHAYWQRSGVILADEVLERTWYQNLYFLRAALRPGVTCPGLFANWSYRSIGTAWHGDYHMNYNTQQPFWATFATNHLELHLPYVELVHFLLPLSRRWAQDYYGLRGAYFPHTAYPVDMQVMPYPVPDWGWEICETPWTVQSLWWHYLYSQDRRFLAERAFEPIQAATLFLVDYVRRPEARGARWGDDRYHIFPTVPPELYGLRPGFDRCHDCLVDLTLTRFVLRAYTQACARLGIEATEAALLAEVADVLAHLPDNPTADTPHGPVFVSVPGERPDVVYNVPNSTMTVFPGEEHGLGSPPDQFALAANSYHQQRNEGGNELVFLNLQGARLGLLDLERFKRQIGYCLLPNGTCADMVLQTLGRYAESTPFDFMAPMGIWFENFGLPAVIAECLLQSYDGTLRLFPNWPREQSARFQTLRAAGAFLVSAQLDRGQVQWVEIVAEVGGSLCLERPITWTAGARLQRDGAEQIVGEPILTVETRPGERLLLRPA